jgi:NDP-sugar pyrophosphorylase family protein
MLTASDFFDLDGGSSIEAVFDGVTFVWDALGRIGEFIAARAPGSTHIGPETTIAPGAILVPGAPIVIGRGCTVEPTAYIRGPVIIGDNVQVRHGAYIRGDCLIGDRCVIGHATEMKNAILLDDAKAPHFAYVGDSILGRRVNLGAGTRLANLKLDSGHVFVTAGGQRVDTGRRKFGAVLADDVETGCNSVLNPGTLIGRRSIVYPNCAIGGYIPADQIAKGPGRTTPRVRGTVATSA